MEQKVSLWSAISPNHMNHSGYYSEFRKSLCTYATVCRFGCQYQSCCWGMLLFHCIQLLTLSIHAEYIYSAASQATSPGGVYILRDFHTLVKNKYWGYWLLVCTIRLLHVCRFSGSVCIRSRPVEAYAGLSGRNGGATSCYVIRLNACLFSASWFPPADALNHFLLL
jgi:hypothetical protein